MQHLLPQQQYATIIDNIDHAMIVINQDNSITLFNAAAQLYTGLSEKFAVNKSFFNCFKAQPTLCDIVKTAIDAGRSFSTHETIVLQAENMQPRQVTVNVSPFFSTTDTLHGAIIILHDLTRVRNLEKAVRYADRSTMIDAMAAGLAHEIKNPLGGIKGSAQLLELELAGNEELLEYTQLIVRESERVNRIIEELLNLSRPRKTKIELLNITLLLDEVIMLQNTTIKDRGITFRAQFDPSIPDIPGDRDLLMRLFLNLVKNSCEATPDHSTITIATRIDSEYHLKLSGSRPTPMVQVSISDQGEGISTTELEKAFTPFYTTKLSGTGLGLPICQKIVTDHAGQMNFNEGTEGGAKVDVSLPLFNPHHVDASNKGNQS